MKFRRVSRKRPCSVCEKPDFCGYSQDGTISICMRVRSDKASKNGGWVHRADSMMSALPTPSPVVTTSPIAPPDKLDSVYSRLLNLLTLSALHRSSLEARGLSPQAIDANLYRSNPSRAYAETVCRSIGDVEGVPGFYFDRGWRMSDYGRGFFIPVRDSKGRIRGLQFRKDEGAPKYLWFSSAKSNKGASSGSPVHFSGELEFSDEVLITEGPLKADCVAHLTGRAVIAAAGVSTFGQRFAARLRSRFPHLRRTLLAFDADFRTNEAVKSHMFKLVSDLRVQAFDVRVLAWDAAAKGLDDHIVRSAA